MAFYIFFWFSNDLILIGKIYILDLYNIIYILLIFSILPWFIRASEQTYANKKVRDKPLIANARPII
jgi:hypothetical protein